MTDIALLSKGEVLSGKNTIRLIPSIVFHHNMKIRCNMLYPDYYI